jgi:glycosyltransferase involved in cell wall biosynthesis
MSHPAPVNLCSSVKLAGVRIARISTVPFIVVTQLKHQIQMHGKLGANVTVVCSDGPDLTILNGLQGVSCEPINISRSISPWLDLFALFRLFIFFKRNHIQIAHSTTPKAGLLTAIAAFLAGVPIRLHTFTGQPWVNMYGMKRWLACSSDKLIGKLNTRCYTDSPSQRQYLIDQQIVDCERLFVIGAGSLAGVDIHRFDRKLFSSSDNEAIRKSMCIPDAAPIILFLGRITADKGVHELLQAFILLKKTIREAHLVFVGPFDIDSGLPGAVERADIESTCDTHIVGYSNCPEAYLAITDILCLPSYREGFGTVVIEAAAMGVPTVGTDIYGLSDAVLHGETGLLIPPRSIQDLTNALIALLTDRTMLVKLGKSAKKRAHSLFDADIMSEKIAQEYQYLLHGKRAFKSNLNYKLGDE